MVENMIMERKENGLISKLTPMKKKVFRRYENIADAINGQNWENAGYQVNKVAKKEKYMANSPFSSASERDRINATLYQIVEKKLDTTVSFYINKKGFAESELGLLGYKNDSLMGRARKKGSKDNSLNYKVVQIVD